MSAETTFEARVRRDLAADLDGVELPHPVWAGSPAAARIAAGSASRSRWGASRLLAVAAVLVVGGAIGVLLAGRDREEAGQPGCPTLADYAAAPAAPSVPFDRAPEIEFPIVSPTASMTTGVQPLGTWVVVADADGPMYQMRVRDARPCDRLPDIRSNYRDGSLLLAQADIQQLRPGGLGPWVGMADRLQVGFGEPPGGSTLPVSPHGVPGVPKETSLRPRADFAQSSLVVFDLPGSSARMTAYVPLAEQPSDGWNLGWLLRDGAAEFSIDPGQGPQPGPTATVGGPVAHDDAATLRQPEGGTATVTAGAVDEVDGYPGYMPPPGDVIVEVLISGQAWSPGRDLADFPDSTPLGLRWVATADDGRVLDNLGDRAATTVPIQAVSPLLPSDVTTFGFLAFEAPEEGPIRLSLQRDGVELAWWSMRD